MGEQVADRRLARGRPQPRCVAVEALQHLQRGEGRQDVGDRLLELERALLDELQRDTLVKALVIDMIANIVSGRTERRR